MCLNSNKQRFLHECLLEGWAPHMGRTARGSRQRLSLTKCGWVIDFYPRELWLMRPHQGKLVTARRTSYKFLRFGPPKPWHVELLSFWNLPTGAMMLDLRRPELGLQPVAPPMPDFRNLKQFIGPIVRLTELLGRPPTQTELINEVSGNVEGVLPDKTIVAIYKQGMGFFWTSRLQGINGDGFQKRRWYYVIPGMTVAKAEAIWKDQLKGSWEVERNADNQN